MKCCCISCCVAVLLVIVLVCVALFVITPEMLGIADDPIFGEKSFRELGLENKTLFEVIKEIMNIMSPPNEADFTGYTEQNLIDAHSKLNVPKDEDGNIDYSSALEKGINNTDEDVQLTDKETAALMNDIIKNSSNIFRPSGSDQSGTEPSGTLPEGETNDGQSEDSMLESISENLTISDMTVGKNANGESTVTLTMGIDIKELMGGSGEESELPPELDGLIHDGLTFITQEYVVESVDGVLVVKENQTYSKMLINGKESEVIMALLSGMSEGESETDMVEQLQKQIGDTFIGMLAQMGADDVMYDADGYGYVNFKPAVTE